jgi:hypothetical protein
VGQAGLVSYIAIDLNPSGFTKSAAVGISGTQQVGSGSGSATGGNSHALLWNGSAASYVDLHPSVFAGSNAVGISGTQQVGLGYTIGGYEHALLWNGSAASFIDLNPSGFVWSIANGTSGTQQVGWGTPGEGYHALLWNGSAGSVIDLNPSGFVWSIAYGTSGTQQVGSGMGSATGDNNHALLWNGSADSYVDLHQFLSSDFISSEALGIAGNGNIIGYATDSLGNTHAILWQVPEPATLLLLGLGAVILRRNAHKGGRL